MELAHIVGWLIVWGICLAVGLVGAKYERFWLFCVVLTVVAAAVGVIYAFTQGGGASVFNVGPAGARKILIGSGETTVVPLFFGGYAHSPTEVSLLLMIHLVLLPLLLIVGRVTADKVEDWLKGSAAGAGYISGL